MIALRRPLGVSSWVVVDPSTPAPAEPAWLRSRPRMSRAAWLAAVGARLVRRPGDDLAPVWLAVGDSGGDPAAIERILRASAGDHGLDWARLATEGAHNVPPLLAFQLMNHMTLCFASILAGLRGPGHAVFARDAAGFVPLLGAAHDAGPALVGGADDPEHPLTRAERGVGGAALAVWLRLGDVETGGVVVADGVFGEAPEPAGGERLVVDLALGAAAVPAAVAEAAARVRAGAARVVVVAPPAARVVAGLQVEGPGPAGWAVVERAGPSPARRRPPERRAWVTAVGAVSPFGAGVGPLWDGLAAGRSALGPLRVLPPAPWPVSAAGEVPLDPAEAGLPAAWVRDRKVAWAALALAQLGPVPPGVPTEWALGLEQAFLEDFGGAWGAPVARAAGGVRYRACADLVVEVLRHRFDLRGPITPHTAACAGGNAALAAAADRVVAGEADVVVAGAADCLLAPLGVLGMARLGAPSPTGRCRPFDADRDGIVLAEGAACFLVETPESARAAGRRPLAEVAGWGASMDAASPSAPDPEGRGARAAMSAALARAGVDRVDWIKAHGTGTVANDSAEAQAIRSLFGHEVPVSSFKGALGHALAAAGALEVAGGLSVFTRDHVPGTAGCERPDGALGLRVVPPAGLAGRVDTWLANSFGFGGQNVSLVLRRPR